jgi:DNA polymerase V
MIHQNGFVLRPESGWNGPKREIVRRNKSTTCAGAVVPARAGLVSRRGWTTKFEMRTPRYTTQVSELPVACA